MEKVEEWGYAFVLLICSLLLVTLILGFDFFYAYGVIAAPCFLLLSAVIWLVESPDSEMAVSCTRVRIRIHLCIDLDDQK